MLVQRQPIRANIPKSTSVSIANHQKIPQNFKIITFDLKTAQKVQNRRNSIKNKFHKAFIPFVFIKLATFYKLGLMK
jgi:hypothetical protein